MAIIGTVLLIAMFEWILWLLAFLYCFGKVYKKADSWSIRLTAVIMMTIFIVLR